MRTNINVKDVEHLVLDTNGVLSASLLDEGKTLVLMENMNPSVIDTNFDELEQRVIALEEKLGMKQ
jgi:hypothetical protein